MLNLRFRSLSLVSLLLLTALSGCHFEAHVGSADEADQKKSKPAKSKVADSSDEAKPTKDKEAASEEDAEPKGDDKAEPSAVELDKESVVLPGNLVFESGKATLSEGTGSDEVLETLKQFLEQQKRITLLRIEGHCDNSEGGGEKLKLSGDRALSIKQWLTAHGIAADRLLATGFAESKPIADNGSEEGRAQNRRVEFKIAKVNGKNYLGNDPLGGGTEFK